MHTLAALGVQVASAYAQWTSLKAFLINAALADCEDFVVSLVLILCEEKSQVGKASRNVNIMKAQYVTNEAKRFFSYA
jgi:hypothetical protein